MTPAISMLPAFLRDLERYQATATVNGIVLKDGHVGRTFDLGHHNKEKLVRAVRSLADAVEVWAKVEPEPVQEQAKPELPKQGLYGIIHAPPADIVMGTAKVEVKSVKVATSAPKRKYTRKVKDE